MVNQIQQPPSKAIIVRYDERALNFFEKDCVVHEEFSQACWNRTMETEEGLA